MTVTSDDFLIGLKERVTVPANQVLLDDAAMLRLADKVIRDELVPMLMSVNQNYLVMPVTVPVVAGQDTYQIHYRSVGRGIRDLKLVEIGASSMATRSLTQVALEHEHEFGDTGQPTAFFFQGDWLVLRPVPVSSNIYLLQQFINLQPNRMVGVSACGKVTSVSGNVITCDQVPTTFQNGLKVDLIQGIAGSSSLAIDLTITNVAANQLTFATAAEIPSTLAIGDYVALAQQSPVIQLPDEACVYLETMTAKRVLYAISDFEGEQALTPTAQQQLVSLLKILEPRAEGAVTKIVNRNGLLARGYGLCRRSGRGYYT